MKYVCKICGYVYEDEKQKVPFSELPDTWTCPLCGAAKSEFEPQGVPAETVKAATSADSQKAAEAVKPAEKERSGKDTGTEAAVCREDDLQKLSPAQLSVICSNLARGCEKQYRNEEAALYTQLAEYFKKQIPEAPEASVSEIQRMLQEDLEYGYQAVRSMAEENKDRGTLRVCTWGEKVTLILNSLVKRYEKEGEAFLADTEIWVCTVCGFTFVGKNPPPLCPVCKVPDWKFEKIEGGNQA